LNAPAPRLDSFERAGCPNNGTRDGARRYFDRFKHLFWRFAFVQQPFGKEIRTFIQSLFRSD
jgi:arylsulfatase